MIVRWSAVALLCVALSGCYNGEMVVDRAWLESDLPVPPPAFVPDSSRKRDGFVQFGFRFAEKRNLETGNEQHWDVAPMAVQCQAQQVINPHLRFVLGGSYSNSTSLWLGPVMSVRNSILRWDIELIMGGTSVEGWIVGHERRRDTEGGTIIGQPDSIQFDDVRIWGQAALRTRMKGTGPWLEGSVLPSFRWGTLEGPPGKTTLDAQVESTIGVLGGGWIQEIRGGSSVILGVRTALVGDKAHLPHYLISVQKRLPRMSR